MLSYIINSLRFPNRRDYLRMSAGIRRRNRLYGTFWSKHLELSREFINQSVGQGERLAILGAGHLFDVDSAKLDLTCKELTLVDIDPTLSKIWTAAFPKLDNSYLLQPVIQDVTYSIDEWSEKIRLAVKQKASLEAIAVVLENLEPNKREHPFDSEKIVSLNLLGQLGIYWRDRFSKLLSADPNCWASPGVLVAPLNEALERSIKKIEQEHLRKLSRYKEVVLLTDIFYYYYTKDESLWQTEDALGLSEEDIKSFFIRLNYKVIHQNSWLWHIAPQGNENKDYGEIHQVLAISLRKK